MNFSLYPHRRSIIAYVISFEKSNDLGCFMKYLSEMRVLPFKDMLMNRSLEGPMLCHFIESCIDGFNLLELGDV